MKNQLLTCLLLASSATVYANEDKLAMLDTNGDGQLSVEEAASDPELSAMFVELDVDQDGYLSASELADA